MMRGLAAWAMSARWRAILVATLGAAGAVLLAPLAYLGAAVVGLVTLRLGAREGAQVMLAGLAGLALLGILGGAIGLSLAIGAAVLWVPVWSLGLLLRASRSLALVLQSAALLAAALVLFAHLGLGDPVAWWMPRIEAVLGPVFADQGLDIGVYLPDLARWMTGAVAAAVASGAVLSLLLARAWQAGLYNPGGFGSEFRALQLGRGFAIAALALVLLAQMPIGGVSVVAADVLLSLLVIYFLQGLAVAHAVVRGKQAHVGWLIGLYALLLVAPQAVALMALAGWMDTWIGVRTRLERRA